MKRLIIITLIITVILLGCSKDNVDSNKDVKPSTDSQNMTSMETSKPTSTNEIFQEDVNDDQIVLYWGIPLNSKDRDFDIIETEDTAQKQKIINKYEREYYLYSDSKFMGKDIGKIEGRGLDYYWQVSFDKIDDYEIAIAKNSNPYPREIKNIRADFPIEFENNGRVLNEVNSQFNVDSRINELTIVDLDGNGVNEYIALFIDKKNYFFAKCLLDSNFKIISYLTVLKEQQNEFVDWEDLFAYFNLQYSGEIIDINSDGVMEILLDFPVYEGFSFKVFTYKDGNFDGEFINMSSLQP